jgi:palmitoyltransferase
MLTVYLACSCAMFILFTTALLITHSYLFMLNLTTIEHLAYERIHTREAILLSNYLDALKDSNGRKLEYWKGLKEKKRVKANWSQQWGNLKSEANTWWLDDRTKAMKREDIGKKTSWYHSIAPNWRQFVGDAWYDSFFPIGRAKSDGLSYEMNWRASHDGSWRPRTEWQRLKERIE